jgi:salicylate hydroxylase
MRAGNKRWNQWNDKEKSREQFGWDADEVVERWYKEGGEMLLKRAVLKAKL